MNFWEDFFSLNKIFIPIIFSILLGFLAMVVFFFIRKPLSELALWVFLGMGFIIGNILKVYLLEKENNNVNLDKKNINHRKKIKK